MAKEPHVYIMTNKYNTVFYAGMTTQLVARVYQHKNKVYKGCFTARYNLTKLVYYEAVYGILYTIKREKQIKAGSRVKKIELIKSMNPEFRDLYEDLI